MIGIIDVGGGMRGIYTAGIYDCLLDRGIKAEYCLGVSAGSANQITYLAGQRGRTHRFYTEYAMRKEYMSLNNLIRTGSYVDMDYVYSTLSNSGGEDPVDYDAFLASRSQMVVVATDARTGQAHYFTRADIDRDSYDVCKASCSLPIACRPYAFRGGLYFDGGVADPVPYRKAFSDGCDKVLVLLTRPRDFVRQPQRHMAAARLTLESYPKVLEGLERRHTRYNEAVAVVKELEREGGALLLAPYDIEGMDTLSKNPLALERLYGYGYQDGAKAAAFLTS